MTSLCDVRKQKYICCTYPFNLQEFKIKIIPLTNIESIGITNFINNNFIENDRKKTVDQLIFGQIGKLLLIMLRTIWCKYFNEIIN